MRLLLLLFMCVLSSFTYANSVSITLAAPEELKEIITPALQDVLKTLKVEQTSSGSLGFLQITALQRGETVALSFCFAPKQATEEIQAALRASNNSGTASWLKTQTLYTRPETRLYLSSTSRSDIMKACKDALNNLLPTS
jgi:DNA polymerase III psi subunit